MLPMMIQDLACGPGPQVLLLMARLSALRAAGLLRLAAARALRAAARA